MGIMKLTNVKIGVEVTIKEISNDEIFLKYVLHPVLQHILITG
jgi:hypothetical protein